MLPSMLTTENDREKISNFIRISTRIFYLIFSDFFLDSYRIFSYIFGLLLDFYHFDRFLCCLRYFGFSPDFSV